MRKYYGEIGLIITAIIWGSGFAATAISLEHYSPYQSMAIRFLVGAVILTVIFHKKIRLINKEILFKGVILGCILYFAFALQTVGLQFTTPSKNAFLTAVNVIIVPLILYLFYKKQLDKFEIIGAILAMTGVGILSLQVTGAINIGDFLSLLCAFAFAFHIIYTAKFVKGVDPILLTLIQLVTAAFIGFFTIAFKHEIAMPFESNSFIALLYLGIFSTTLAYLLQTTAQKYLSETKAAIILSTEALWGMIFSMIIIGEIISVRMAIGALLILSAIIISETKLNVLKIRAQRRS